MPFGFLAHMGHAVKQQYRMKNMIANRKAIPGAVSFTPGKEPLLVVLALGESLRSDHLSLYGYPRVTNRYTQASSLNCFRTVYSAGSGTTPAVTGLLTRATISDPALALREQSVISLFRRAGFRTLWLTNQGSMATGETWVASIANEAEIYKIHPSVYQMGAKLQDKDLIEMLDAELAQPLMQDTFIVLHSYGSHVHPEARYGEPFRVFTPICETVSVSDCTREHLINSYDNSAVATDHYWAELIRRLASRKAVLLITSDHGSRLYGVTGGRTPPRWITPNCGPCR